MEPIRYAVAYSAPHTHLFEVEGLFPPEAHAAGAAELSLPAWTPGSYLLREYARHVQDVTARDASGKGLSCTRIDKRTWRIARPADGGPITARWRVFARELTVRTSHLDDELAYFNGATLFLTAAGLADRPIELSIEETAGRPIVCALPRVEGSAGHTFRARDFDELVDSPVLVAECELERFTVLGKEHTLALFGGGNYDRAKLTRDLASLVATEAALFGGELPYERYAFLVLLSDRGRGGLEHKASCTLLYPRRAFQPAKAYEDFLQLAAHELFHLWNVKRIRPAALTPYDYGREQHTRLLWAFEGITSYYDTLLPLRAGLYGSDRYLEQMGERATDVERTPGRKVASLEEASFCAWIKYYRPDENSPNSTVSYYVQGEVMAMLLDLAIRRETKNARTLDDVMRLLWTRYGLPERGVPEDGVEAAVIEVGGEALRPFFDAYVRGTEPLPLEELLATAGVRLGRRVREGDRDRGGTPPTQHEAAERGYLGMRLRGGDRPVVTHVFTDTPAERAGLSPDDELVAIDGEKLDGGHAAKLDEQRPGDRCTLHVFRRGRLRTLEVEFAQRPKDTLYFELDPTASEAQLAVRASWLGRA